MKKNSKLPRNSKLWKLSPFLDDGILKISGRIGRAAVPNEMKTPVILPSKHVFTDLLILREHQRCAHQGHATVLSNLRNRFWIVDGRAAVRRAAERCQFCKLARAKPIIPKMGELPYYRLVTKKHPFTYTGVDLMGPIEVVVGRHHEKRWVAVFTCMVTRAVHIEVVHALSTDETMMALSRFVDTRGRPSHIYSENGTNFVGAKKVLHDNWASLDWNSIMNMDKFSEIKWQFSPPCSPHFGGAWERMVGATKKILKKTLHEKFPKDQTLITMLKGAENIINSRPLTYGSSDPADLQPLTPNHFLRGFADVGPGIPGSFDEDDEVVRLQWRKAQYFIDQFWERWTKEALPELIRREKWHHDGKPVQHGDVVLIVNDQAPRNTWVRAIVTATFPGSDGEVRVVEVETADPATKRRVIYKRGVDKICPLGLSVENQD